MTTLLAVARVIIAHVEERRRIRRLRHRFRRVPFGTLEHMARTGLISADEFQILCYVKD